MTEHLTMNTVVHAAVRRDLDRIDRALAALAPGDRAQAVRVDRAWRFLDAQLTHHHHSEEELFWPALRRLGVAEELVGDLDGEHEAMAEAMAFTRAAMAAMAADPSADRIAETTTAVGALRKTIVTHFAHEEADLEPVAARLQDAPEMKQASAAVARTQSLPAVGAMLAWLLDDADQGARTYVATIAPKPLLVVVPRLFGGRYRKVALS